LFLVYRGLCIKLPFCETILILHRTKVKEIKWTNTNAKLSPLVNFINIFQALSIKWHFLCRPILWMGKGWFIDSWPTWSYLWVNGFEERISVVNKTHILTIPLYFSLSLSLSLSLSHSLFLTHTHTHTHTLTLTLTHYPSLSPAQTLTLLLSLSFTHFHSLYFLCISLSLTQTKKVRKKKRFIEFGFFVPFSQEAKTKQRRKTDARVLNPDIGFSCFIYFYNFTRNIIFLRAIGK